MTGGVTNQRSADSTLMAGGELFSVISDTRHMVAFMYQCVLTLPESTSSSCYVSACVVYQCRVSDT